MSKFQVAPLFTDKMVLQRGKNIPVFGTGEDGVTVSVTLCGKTETCVVSGGKWKVVFSPMGACRFMSMTVEDDEDFVTFENVAIGEVWLAGGQSNMQVELIESVGGKEILENDVTDDVRCFNVPRKTTYDEDYEEAFRAAHWSDFSDKEDAAHWSAVAYHCAKLMSEYMDVTVGIINCNWGGTSISCWLGRKFSRGAISVWFDEFDEAMAKTTPEQATADYHEYQKKYAEWKEKREEYFRTAEEPNDTKCYAAIGDKPAPVPAPCSPRSPSLLYESLIKRIAPYSMAGVLWYQGENDAPHPEAYYTGLTNLIRNWREDWRDDELTFIIGQLPVFGGRDPDGDSWSIIREAQMRVYKTIKNTGIVVLLDCGEKDTVHPLEKREVGRRFAMQTLEVVYGGCDGASAPIFKNAIRRGDTLELQFDNIRAGFKLEGEPNEFEICGEDGVYVPAYADVSGTRIFLSADGIEHPCGARYLWKNYGEVNVFSGFNLPLAPFRIDNI